MEDENILISLAKEFNIESEILQIEFQDEELYHYTSAYALQEILKKKKLRFTDSNYLNDINEGEYIFTILKDVIEEDKYKDIRGEIKKILNGEISYRLQENETFKSLSEKVAVDTESMKKLLGTVLTNKFFVCCFSTNDDSLPMWHYYTKNNAGGYNIRFNASCLIQNIKQELELSMQTENRKYIAEIYMYKVIYDKEKQINLVKKILDSYINNPNKNFKIIFLAICLQIVGYFFKHKEFSNEKEVRIIIEFNSELHFDFLMKNIELQERNGLFRPYIDINFLNETIEKSFNSKEIYTINGITLSPLFSEKLYAESMKLLLNKYGFFNKKTKIKSSDIPFRNM